MIKINNLVKSYDHRRVVDIKDLTIPEKMIFGIVGGNGSGKSTLLKMMSKLVTIDLGTIETGIDVKEMVYLFQQPHLFNTSVYNNIAAPLKFRRYDKTTIDQKVQEMIDLFDLGHIIDQNAKKLSGGEAQKVNLARALVFGPKWLLLDEPTANIDPKSTMQIEEILRKQDLSMVLVTHNLSQAERLCDRVAVMSEGKILQVDQPAIALKNQNLLYI